MTDPDWGDKEQHLRSTNEPETVQADGRREALLLEMALAECEGTGKRSCNAADSSVMDGWRSSDQPGMLYREWLLRCHVGVCL
jgi:hypothetical protein